MSNTKAIKSYQGFEEGSYAARKGRLCQIKKIHFEMHPPSVTVLMKDTDTEVGTEFDRLKHIKSWFCDVCTAQNNDTSATKCSFCKMDRSFKEKLIIQDENEQNNQQQSNKQMASENTKQSESTELILSAESDETEPDETVEQEPEQQENEIDDEYEIINAPQHKQPEYEQKAESESESESESEDEEEAHTHGYRERPVHNGYYYDEDEYAKYQHRNRMNRNRDRMNRNRNAFGFGGWNAFPSFDRFFL